MTTRLYYTDAACLTFAATVAAVGDDGRRLYLDRTAFYPTSGGQPHDTGVLHGVRVVDVVDEGARIAHVLEAPAGVAVGDTVTGTIDAARRRDHMQQHTGQHLLSAVFADLRAAPTVSVHFGSEVSLIELDAPALARDALVDVERRANALVAEALPVEVSFADAAEATGLRKVPDRDGVIRIVTIADVDRSACGGTHVRTTAEIGPILLGRTERIRQRTRVEFVCGQRALARARADFEALAALAGSLSASPADVPALVAAQGERVRGLEQERRALLEDAATERARLLHATSEQVANGTRVVIERTREGRNELQRQTAQAITVLPRVVYVAADDDRGTLMFATSADTGVHAGNVLKAVVGVAGGRGGGSPRIAQGSVSPRALPEVIDALARSVRG